MKLRTLKSICLISLALCTLSSSYVRAVDPAEGSDAWIVWQTAKIVKQWKSVADRVFKLAFDKTAGVTQLSGYNDAFMQFAFDNLRGNGAYSNFKGTGKEYTPSFAPIK